MSQPVAFSSLPNSKHCSFRLKQSCCCVQHKVKHSVPTYASSHPDSLASWLVKPLERWAAMGKRRGESTLLGSSREVSSSLDFWHSWPTKPGCVHWPQCASDTDAGAGGVEGGEVASLAACCPDCVPTIVCQPDKLFQTTWRSGVIRDLFVFSVQYLTPTTSLNFLSAPPTSQFSRMILTRQHEWIHVQCFLQTAVIFRFFQCETSWKSGNQKMAQKESGSQFRSKQEVFAGYGWRYCYFCVDHRERRKTQQEPRQDPQQWVD